MKQLLILTVLYCLSVQAFAQRKKAIFAEAGGNGILYTANFDIRLKKDRNDGFGFRAGIGGGADDGYAIIYSTDPGGNLTYNLSYVRAGIVTVPLAVNYIVGKRRSGLEAGVGATLAFVNASFTGSDFLGNVNGVGVIGVLSLGYRYQPIRKGIMCHINWTPLFNSSEFNAGMIGVGVGYSFK